TGGTNPKSASEQVRGGLSMSPQTLQTAARGMDQWRESGRHEARRRGVVPAIKGGEGGIVRETNNANTLRWWRVDSKKHAVSSSKGGLYTYQETHRDTTREPRSRELQGRIGQKFENLTSGNRFSVEEMILVVLLVNCGQRWNWWHCRWLK
ncbi:unnamed protein product, partial [Ectocarpus sp. 12 AP-2014]